MPTATLPPPSRQARPTPAPSLTALLKNAESNLVYVNYHAYGKLDGAECQSLARALEDVRAAITRLEAPTS